MSKEAALRAMREARYAERTAGPTTAARQRTTPAVRPPATKAAAPTASTSVGESDATDGLCGHRSMNGRTCTRERGHEAKSHRYG
jgi:hypothetical protein